MRIFSKAGVVDAWQNLVARLNGAGEVVPALVMRLVMGWEFFEAGREKLNGSNWFDGIRDQFPFPFDIVPTALSWQIATWFELVGAVCLWLGLATRFWAFNLLFLTFVATAAVHWPDMWSMWSDLLKGYAISDHGHGNFKLPLLFVVMLLPLVFTGAGKLSLDHLVARWFAVPGTRESIADLYAWSLAALVLGIPFLMLLPWLGGILIAVAIGLASIGRFVRA
jgi:putative oxidoreductase